ncbi:MAG: putative ABC transporter permease [Clostridiales bacterium]|nr:putative ABC transporter permease [Clostridiales bacterium]
MSKFLKINTLWLWGGFIYYLIEVLWRGSSHPSMFIVGGLCFLLIGGINNFLPWEMGIARQSVIGGIVVTVVEFIGGLIINKWLGLNVWDYSDLPLNLLGQVSLPFTFAWMALAVVGILLDDYLRWKLYGEKKPWYTLWTRRR